jgi:energy-converting hydrogenase Eha subunit H
MKNITKTIIPISFIVLSFITMIFLLKEGGEEKVKIKHKKPETRMVILDNELFEIRGTKILKIENFFPQRYGGIIYSSCE